MLVDNAVTDSQRIKLGENGSQVAKFGEPFSYKGDDTSNATLAWEMDFQKGDPDAVGLLETMGRKQLGAYYNARASIFERLAENETTDVEKSDFKRFQDDYKEIAGALFDEGMALKEQEARNLGVTLEYLITQEQFGKSVIESPAHKLSEIHQKARQLLKLPTSL